VVLRLAAASRFFIIAASQTSSIFQSGKNRDILADHPRHETAGSLTVPIGNQVPELRGSYGSRKLPGVA